MKADLFYTSVTEFATEIVFISETQWQEGSLSLTPAEHNYFTLKHFKGKVGECCFLNNADGLLDRVFVGTGEGDQEKALAQAALSLPPGSYQLQQPTSQEAALYWALAQYRFLDYKKQEFKPRLLVIGEVERAALLPLVESIFLVRDLINKPANDMGPQQLAEVVKQLAVQYGAELEQWVGEELLRENFPAIHAVGRAAASPPRLLSLTWGNLEHPKVTLVGKGVCFDSGGLDLKPSNGMRLMKKDMGGAAHVIGLAKWIMASRLPIRLKVLIPAVENAVGPDAFRPGDVLTMRQGLTVEIDNTDAEGRLILADALTKACEDQPELLIDFATLTGAARIAVGTEIGAMFSNDDLLAADIMEASNKTKDPVWRMPLFSPYADLLNSSVADLANCSTSPYAGAIIAGLFLQKFITKQTPWLHFDIMAWNLSSKPGKPEGGEAMGLRAVAQYLLKRFQ